MRFDYLRLSLTDRCNLRCYYCLPMNYRFNLRRSDLLSFEEILRITKILLSLGVRNVRLTGGEPLMRKGIIRLVQLLTGLKGLEELSITTNGTLLLNYLDDLRKLGIKRINISLDTLKRDRFIKFTNYDGLPSVLKAIMMAKEMGFNPIKINTVLMRGVNDDEIIDFIKFASNNNLIQRFIEFMEISPLWHKNYYLPVEEAKKICSSYIKFEELNSKSVIGNGPAQYYLTSEGKIIGFIATKVSNCMQCSRLRLSADGQLRLCLYQESGLSLLTLLRCGISDDEIRSIILKKLSLKTELDYRRFKSSKHHIYMCSLGG